MPIVPRLTTTVLAGHRYYRITSLRFRTPQVARHKKVVNGEGAVDSLTGGRYNHPGARAVYLAEDPLTCFAEKMFYFHREVIGALDISHITKDIPQFQRQFIVWAIVFQKSVPDVYELSPANSGAKNIYPSLMLNPSQDYEHLKKGRAAIQHDRYKGLRAPSCRVRGTGNRVVLFEDQSKNVQSIVPFQVEFRLITSANPPVPFANHALDLLDFTSGEVRVNLPAAPNPHPVFGAYQDWTRVDFNH